MPSESHPAAPALLALFGGTFDPIHYGHLKPVTALAQAVGLGHITLLPNHVPPHRPQPEASPAQRLAMVRLAIVGNPLFSTDDRELQRRSPSYTIDTLEALRAELGPTRPLAFIIGQDSLLSLHKWQRWQDILHYCHLLVCARPGYPDQLETAALQAWLEQHRTRDVQRLHRQPHGFIYLADTPLLSVSATDIRQRRHLGISCDDLLPRPVQRYIELQGLYR